MPKEHFGIGLEKNGPHRQGEKGGKGGTVSKAGRSQSGPIKTQNRRADTGETKKGNPIGSKDTRTSELGKF